MYEIFIVSELLLKHLYRIEVITCANNYIYVNMDILEKTNLSEEVGIIGRRPSEARC